MIHFINKYGRKETTLTKVDSGKWEFILNPSMNDHYENLEFKEPIFIGKKGIIDIITGLKDLLKNKQNESKEYPINWLLNNANLIFRCYFYESINSWYDINWFGDNKALKKFMYDGQQLLREEIEDINIARDGKSGTCIMTTKENIQKYINDLEKEIGKPITNWEGFEKEGK